MTTLGQIVEATVGSIKTGPFGTVLKAAEYTPTGVPVISTGEVRFGSFSIQAKTPRVSSGTTARLSEYLLQENDLVFARKGSIDRSARVKASEVGYFLGSDALRVRLGEGVDARFIGYQLLSPRVRSWLVQHAGGTTMPSLNQGILSRIPLAVPPVDEQRRIASTLDAFDNLIDANRRTAAAALDMSIVLFSQMAPRSEDFVKLCDVTKKIGSGATPRGGSEVYQDTGVSLIRSQNVYDGQFSFDGLARISDVAADALSGVTVHPGDVLVNITGESVTRTALVPDRALPARVSQHVAIVRPDPEVLGSGFLMLALLSAPIKAHLNGLSTAGATRRALTKAHLGETRIACPPLVEQLRVSRLMATIDELSAEIADLTRARDELLPLLISGKVRVPELEAVA